MLSPNLHIFNPSCETAIANSTVSFVPNKTLLRFEEDLAFLPSILAQNDDLILMPQYEDLSHIELLHSLSFPVPGQILQSDFFDEHQKIISDIEQYKLWGWAPNWIHRLKKNKRVQSIRFEKSAFYNWKDIHKEIYSRKTASSILKSIISKQGNSVFIPQEFLPKPLKNIKEVEQFLTKHQQIVLKEPWSSSGRGIMMLRKSSLNTSIIQRINGVLKQQDYIMAEVLMNKQLDMAMHFELKNKSVYYKGETYFQTNSNGQYQANYLNQQPDTNPEIIEFIKDHKKALQEALTKAISESNIPQYYEGFLGVDVMVVEIDNQLKLQPCVEINLRNNMGTIALHLQDIIHPEAKGTFNIVFNPKSSFENVYKRKHIEHSILDGKIFRGSLPLVAPKGKQFGAFINLV